MKDRDINELIENFNQLSAIAPMDALWADKSQFFYGNVLDWVRDQIGYKDSELAYMLMGKFLAKKDMEHRKS